MLASCMAKTTLFNATHCPAMARVAALNNTNVTPALLLAQYDAEVEGHGEGESESEGEGEGEIEGEVSVITPRHMHHTHTYTRCSWRSWDTGMAPS